MKQTIIFSLFCIALPGQPQYISLSPSQEALWNPPSPTVTNLREEFRLTVSSAPTSDLWDFKIIQSHAKCWRGR